MPREGSLMVAVGVRSAAERTPERSLAQRMSALENANEIRMKLATLKKEIKRHEVKVWDVLLEPPEYAATMKVFDLLLATPKYGQTKTLKVLSRCRVSPSKT